MLVSGNHTDGNGGRRVVGEQDAGTGAEGLGRVTMWPVLAGHVSERGFLVTPPRPR